MKVFIYLCVAATAGLKYSLIQNYIPPPKLSGSALGSKFGAACFTFTENSSVVTACFLRGMNTDVKKLFSVFVSYQIFLLNMPAKDNQETAKATARAQLRRYVDEVSTMILLSNIFKFWPERRRESPVLFTLSTNTLCVPASSAPLERIFSASGLIMRPQ